jgi:hypothetical protein
VFPVCAHYRILTQGGERAGTSAEGQGENGRSSYAHVKSFLYSALSGGSLERALAHIYTAAFLGEWVGHFKKVRGK